MAVHKITVLLENTNLYFHWCPNDHGPLQEVLVELWWVVILIQHRDKNLCEAVFALSVFSFHIEIIF